MKNHTIPPPCDDWAEQLAAARFSTSSLGDVAALDTHIASCEGCAAAKREYDKIDKLMSAMQFATALPGLPPRLLQLWEEEDRQVALRASSANALPVEAQKHVAGSSYVRYSSNVALATLSLTTLEKCCQEEVDNYRKGEGSDDRYCLEIFQRALKKQDNEAYELLVRNFRGMAVGWLRSHPRYDSAMRYESEDNYVIEAFARLWNARHDKSTDFETLGAALFYLKRCLITAVQDTLRFYEKQMAQLPEAEGAGLDELMAQEEDDGRELWEIISSILPTKREQSLAYLLYHCNLKPREIIQYCPSLFGTVSEVYRLRRNIIDRLMRNMDQIRWRLGD